MNIALSWISTPPADPNGVPFLYSCTAACTPFSADPVRVIVTSTTGFRTRPKSLSHSVTSR